MTKTTEEWFKELPAGYAELAERNRTDSYDEDSAQDAVLGGFVWASSLEGFRFWNEFAAHLCDPDEYDIPKLPE